MKNILTLMAAVVVMLSVACNPPGVTLVMENDFDFEYFDFQIEEPGELEGFISSESFAYSQVVIPEDGADSFIMQQMHVTFNIDTGQYNMSVPAFRGISLSFTNRIELADATVIDLDAWDRPIYSYSNPEQYLVDFFPEGSMENTGFGFGLMMDGYGYLNSVETGIGPSEGANFMITQSEIITDDNDRQFIYVEGQFTGKTFSAGYPTVPMNSGTVIEVTQGNFKGKWLID